jgi:cytochrome c-type biogenesis protein
MDGYIVGIGIALWLGILTSISPCPLATNIAAVSFISKNLGKSKNVMLSGLLYTAGRMLTYTAIGALLVASIMSMPALSAFLNNYMNKLLGPILIIAGMFLLELIEIGGKGSALGEKMQKFTEKSGLWGAFPLGIVFALTFCPISAALFFGSLIPLAVTHNSSVLLPSLYGIGTSIPVVIFALILTYSANLVSKAFTSITKVEFWARRITGTLFILIGIYYTLSYIFGVI